jgi:hypothetical protein
VRPAGAQAAGGFESRYIFSYCSSCGLYLELRSARRHQPIESAAK